MDDLSIRKNNDASSFLYTLDNVHLTSEDLIRYECVLGKDSSDWQFIHRMLTEIHQVHRNTSSSPLFYQSGNNLIIVDETIVIK